MGQALDLPCAAGRRCGVRAASTSAGTRPRTNDLDTLARTSLSAERRIAAPGNTAIRATPAPARAPWLEEIYRANPARIRRNASAGGTRHARRRVHAPVSRSSLRQPGERPTENEFPPRKHSPIAAWGRRQAALFGLKRTPRAYARMSSFEFIANVR